MAPEGNDHTVVVVILGPDGCGKSSVIDHLKRKLSHSFSQIRIIHLRPRMGNSGAEQRMPVVDPHNRPVRGLFPSVAKLIYLLVDYSAVHVWRWRRSSSLIIFDRYYQDLLVDPRRYRYGAPIWLARCFGNLVPSPDLWILLDAPAEVIHSRKQEVPFVETLRQREAYLSLVRRFRNAHVIDASAPLAQVIQSAERLILARALDGEGSAARRAAGDTY